MVLCGLGSHFFLAVSVIKDVINYKGLTNANKIIDAKLGKKNIKVYRMIIPRFKYMIFMYSSFKTLQFFIFVTCSGSIP